MQSNQERPHLEQLRLSLTTYDTLLQQVRVQGCFTQTYWPFAGVGLLTCLGIGISAYVVTVTDSLWVQVINGLLAGFFSVQAGLIGHDLSHNSVFKDAQRNKRVAKLVWGIAGGLSESHWFRKHNAHHEAPNHIGHDPDIEIPFVFDETQVTALSPFKRKYLLPYQHILFWIGIWFVYPRNILLSMRHLLRKLSWSSLTEIGYIMIHFVLVLGFTYWFLPPLIATAFNLAVVLAISVYMALIFAPNHKGEVMLESTHSYNWVYQIACTRNLISSPLLSYVFGGLNYQIEHHLFPTMSRFNYARARLIVRDFCKKHHIPYKEVTWLDSLKQIHQALRAATRTPQPPTPSESTL